MLLLDGCFLHTRFVPSRAATQPVKDIREDRDIFFLLENQLPFFVLEEIHKLITPDENCDVVIDSVLGRVEALLRRSEYSVATVPRRFPTPLGPPCLLHLLHMYFRPTILDDGDGKQTVDGGSPSRIISTPNWRWSSATYYRAAGVKFKPRKVGHGPDQARSILDVVLRGSTLHVPCLRVDHDTFRMLRNMVALEQQSSSKHLSMSHVTTYCFFLSQLAATEKDVELLVAKKILMHMADDTRDLAEGLAGLFDDMILDPADNPGRSYLSTEHDALEKLMALFWKRQA